MTDLSQIVSRLFGWVPPTAVALLIGCVTPTPTPDPPGPGPAPVVGTFAGFHDCTAQDNTAGIPWANTCGDVDSTGQCFEDLAAQGASRALLLCAARDVESAGFVEIAKGTAEPELTARAQRLRAWLAGTGATLRSTPRNHKRRRPKHKRRGCLYCKPWKDERAAKVEQFKASERRRMQTEGES